jgi:hypothetical protein
MKLDRSPSVHVAFPLLLAVALRAVPDVVAAKSLPRKIQFPISNLTLGMLLGCLLVNGTLRGEDASPPLERHEIRVAVSGQEPFVFGTVLGLKVTYRNRDLAFWEVSDPPKSPGVRLNYKPAGSTERPQGYGMGRLIRTVTQGPGGMRMEATALPKVEKVRIEPDKTLEFDAPFERGWTGDVVPGHWTVWIEDETEQVKSNKIDIAFVFTPESMRICLAIAQDKSQPILKRKSHANWLRKIDAKLQLTWPRDDLSETEKAKMEDPIQASLKEFQAFIDNQANEKSVLDAIGEINRAAGVTK